MTHFRSACPPAESGMKMLQRYRGRIPAKQLATYPATLTAFFGRVG